MAASSSSSSSWAASLLGGYSEAALSAAFSKVADKANWKMPVAAVLPADTSKEELALIAYAIGFYTGSEAKISASPNWVLVEAPGYYAAVGA